jgi:hypothetical protein
MAVQLLVAVDPLLGVFRLRRTQRAAHSRHVVRVVRILFPRYLPPHLSHLTVSERERERKRERERQRDRERERERERDRDRQRERERDRETERERERERERGKLRCGSWWAGPRTQQRKATGNTVHVSCYYKHNSPRVTWLNHGLTL